MYPRGTNPADTLTEIQPLKTIITACPLHRLSITNNLNFHTVAWAKVSREPKPLEFLGRDNDSHDTRSPSTTEDVAAANDYITRTRSNNAHDMNEVSDDDSRDGLIWSAYDDGGGDFLSSN